MNTTDKPFSAASVWYHLFILLLIFSQSASADTVLQNNVIVHYSKIASDRMELDIRPIGNMSIGKVSANLAGVDLPVSGASNYPAEQQTTAILFLSIPAILAASRPWKITFDTSIN